MKLLTLTRLAALAAATDEEAERQAAAGRPDLANVYAGKALGLMQAIEMLQAEYPYVLAASS